MLRTPPWEERAALKRGRPLAFLEVGLWAIGMTAFLLAVFAWTHAQLAQKRGAVELAELLRSSQPAASHLVSIEEGAVFGRIDIERLGLSAIVFEGAEQTTLSKGVGHLPGTGNTADHQNLVLAAHRDTFFQPLRDVREGDQIVVITVKGSKTFVVHSWEIVEPSAVEVLRNTATPMLTLVTCYPFAYVGSAPHRFVVHAVPAGE